MTVIAGSRSEPTRQLRRELAGRVREVQRLIFGHRGTTAMARSLDVAPETWWFAIREDRAIDGRAILKLIYRHRVEPQWLLRGTGPMFRHDAAAATTPAGHLDRIRRIG